MFSTIKKRDGREVPYDRSKITGAINKAMSGCYRKDEAAAARLAEITEKKLTEKFADNIPTVEDIQDMVVAVLKENGYAYVSQRYSEYRSDRTRVREMNSHLMQVMGELTFTDALDSDMKRDNANIDGDTAMGTMLKYGSEAAKDFYEKYILSREQCKAHRSGDIHIHDFDFYTLTTTCCQIDLKKLFKGGFSTGHGFLREPQHIQSYAALACIAIQSNQNDQHGGQSIPNFDYGLADGVAKTYRNLYNDNFAKALDLTGGAKESDTLEKLTSLQKGKRKSFQVWGRTFMKRFTLLHWKKPKRRRIKQHIKPWLRLFTILIPCIPAPALRRPSLQ